MLSFKNPVFPWVIVIIIIIIIFIWPPRPFPWPPPCLVCGDFMRDFFLPLVFGVMGVIGLIQNLRSNDNFQK